MPRRLTDAEILRRAQQLGFKAELREIQEARKKLAGLIEADIAKWYERADELYTRAQSEQVKFWVLQMVVERIMPVLKHSHTTRVDQTPKDENDGKERTVIQILNVNRGTEKAREQAITEQGKMWDALEAIDREKEAEASSG